jgi:hypothetical protein
MADVKEMVGYENPEEAFDAVNAATQTAVKEATENEWQPYLAGEDAYRARVEDAVRHAESNGFKGPSVDVLASVLSNLTGSVYAAKGAIEHETATVRQTLEEATKDADIPEEQLDSLVNQTMQPVTEGLMRRDEQKMPNYRGAGKSAIGEILSQPYDG